MFESITQGIRSALSFIDKGRLTESNIREGLRKVRQALLEADVNYDVARDFVERVTRKAVGERVLKSLRPSEQIIGIVYEELVNLMGPVDHSLHLRRDDVTVIMLCGLQGSGKTTTCGKLARMLKEAGWQPMLVAADLQRPAAIEQLKVIGEQIDVPVYSEPPEKSNAVQVCQNALAQARKSGDIRVLILDTAGRLHIDEELMRELELIDRKIMPHQVLLVCDAMTGQDAVNSAKAFNEALELDGVILTKLDGDTRGGAALSVKAVTGVPIKFIGVGEQLDRLEEFHPDRMASRILGMGDIISLVEKARREIDEETALAQQQKMLEGKFTLEDFQKAMHQMRRMGPLKELLTLIPGLGGLVDSLPVDEDPEEELRRIDAIINSMTPDERRHPEKIDRSRRMRIARGSGTDPSEVSRLIKDFDQMAAAMQKMAGLGVKDRLRAVTEIAKTSLTDPGATWREKRRSKRGPLDPIRAKELKKKKRKEAKKARKRNRR